MIKRIFIASFVALCSTIALAQNYKIVDSTYSRVTLDHDSLYFDDFSYLDDYHFWDNIFVLAQIGTSHSMSENTRFGNFFDVQRPSFNIGVGKWLYPSFGLRVTAGLHPQVGRANWELSENWPDVFGNYNFNIFSAYLDGLVNFSNILYKYRESRVFNLIGIIGLGYDHTFGFDKVKCNIMRKGITLESGSDLSYDVDTKPGDYFAFHIGLQGRWKVSSAWDITGEITFNGTDDKYNGHVYDRRYDTYFDFLLGAQFHFLDCHGRRRFHYVKHLNSAVIERLQRMQDDENEKLDAALMAVPEVFENLNFNEALQTTISFYIDRYYITDAQKKNVKSVAVFLETHPNINLIITGYADVETAYPAYNLRLSQKRAQAVYDMLVNEFHVPKNRLRIDYKGDSVQPYESVNEWNRAVIFFLDKGDGSSQVLQ